MDCTALSYALLGPMKGFKGLFMYLVTLLALLARDAAMLCSPPTKKYPGRPFKPTIAQPVDMFPSTKHCEMVMTFDRMSEEEYEKYHGTK